MAEGEREIEGYMWMRGRPEKKEATLYQPNAFSRGIFTLLGNLQLTRKLLQLGIQALTGEEDEKIIHHAPIKTNFQSIQPCVVQPAAADITAPQYYW